jgi:Holliday junction resolvasome RuvABC endonuclease subunit
MNDLTILALDCSSTTIGVCYDGRIQPTITLKSDDVFRRALLGWQAVSCLLDLYGHNVDLVVMELPASRFNGALIPQCHVQGHIGASLVNLGIAVHRFAPSVAKQVLTGKGNADKAMMIAATMTRLPHIGKPDEHAADAFALWLCGKQLKVSREAV